MAFMVVTDNIVRVAKDGCIYEFIRFVSQEDKGKVYCIARKDDGETEVSVLKRSELPKNEYEAIRMLKKSKLSERSMDIKEYKEFREACKRRNGDGLDTACEFRTCAEYLMKLSEAIDGNYDMEDVMAVIGRAREALYYTETMCMVLSSVYGMFKDMEKKQLEASTDNSYVTITYELMDKDDEHEGAE